LGLLEFQQGNIVTSIHQYKKTLELQPSSYAAHYNLALAYLRQHKLREGHVHLEQAVKLDPRQADAVYDLGIVLLELGRPALALPYLLRARIMNPNRSDVQFNVIRGNIESGKVAQARSEAEAAQQLTGDFQWNAALGQLFLKNAQPRDAIVYFRRAAVIRGDDPAIRRQLAAAYLEVGESKQVLELLPEPRTGEEHYLLGSAYYLNHRFEEADRESERAMATIPENPRALVLRVRLLQRAGQQEQALELARKAAVLAPTWDEPFYLGGVSAYFIRHYAEASQLLARAIELNASSTKALFLQGIALASQEKVPEAERLIRRAIALQPKNARFHCHL
jgi:tetratricopeptide (TPR) repeat protein